MNDQSINIDKLTAQYVRLRDVIAEKDDAHKKEMAPFREMLDKLNGVLLEHLTRIGADKAAGPSGTVYKTLKKSATIADVDKFRTYVTQTGSWDLIDWKANKTGVADFVEENEAPPPGVNYSTHFEVGVRRK